MPAYWFMYNMYALARNSYKYIDRDKRINKTQFIEYSFLAPDSVNEIFTALDLLRNLTALAYKLDQHRSEVELLKTGDELLNEKKSDVKEIDAYGFQNAKKPAQLIKVWEAYTIYKELIVFYAAEQILNFIRGKNIKSFEELQEALPSNPQRTAWKNIGGQLIPEEELNSLLSGIKEGNIKGWDEVHGFYEKQGQLYTDQKLQHAYASLLDLLQISVAEFNSELFRETIERALETKEWIIKSIYESRAKDYENEFRRMTYDDMKEMEEVLGKLEDNIFLQNQEEELKAFRLQIENTLKLFQLSQKSSLVRGSS